MSDLGATQLKNIAEPIRVYSLEFRRPLSLTKQNMSILKQIGRELNVRYVLEGSVRRSGNLKPTTLVAKIAASRPLPPTSHE
jgi:hypothetical protein